MLLNRTKMNPRNVTLLCAAVLAFGTGLLLYNYLSGVNTAANKVEAKRVVLVAARDIAAQTVITADMLDRAVRPATSVEPDSVDPAQIQSVIGTVALVAIPAGGTLTQSRVARPSAVSLTAKVKKGLRAVTIPIDRVKGVAGLIETGDRVDVIAIQAARGDGAPPAARTILRGINVLAMGSTFTTSAAGATPAPDAGNVSTATLEVTPKQANLLALADVNTILRLALRSPDEPVGSLPVEPISFATAPLVVAPAVSRPTPAPATVASARPRPIGPIIIDGDKIVGADQR